MDFLEYRILRWLLFSGTLWNFTDHLQRLYHLRNSGHFLHIILNQNELVRLTSDRRKLLSLMKRSRGQLRIARASRMPHSSGQVELPPGQGQLLHTLEAWDEEIPLDNQYNRDAADVSDADTEFSSIEELLLFAAKDSRDLSCMGNNLEDSSVVDSDKMRSGKSQDDPILLDSDVRDSEEFGDSLGSSSLPLEGLNADEITLDLCGAQTAIDDATRKATLADMNDTPPLASLSISEWETESGFCCGSGDDAGPVYEAEGVLMNADKIDKCQLKSMRGKSDEEVQEAQPSFTGNDDGDEIETDLRTKRSEDHSESMNDIDDEDHVNYSSGSDIEERPRRSKRRRQAKSAEDSAQISSYTTKDASFSITNSSDVSSQGTATILSDSSQESQEIPIRGFLTLKTSQSGTLYCLQFSQEMLPFPLEVEQRQDVTSSASTSSGDIDWERPSLRKRGMTGRGRNLPFSQVDKELLIQLKEEDQLRWAEIVEYFPGRSKGTLQVHYCTKLKRRLETSKKSKKRKRVH